jgi:hypothetical protein
MVLVMHDPLYGLWNVVLVGNWACSGLAEHHMFGEMPGQRGPAVKAKYIGFLGEMSIGCTQDLFSV